MKQLLLCLLFPCLLHAQTMEGYYSDYLKNNDGSPLINVLIQNRNTMKKAFSDKSGFFQVHAKVGDMIRVYYPSGIKDITIEKGMLYANFPRKYLPEIMAVNSIVTDDYTSMLKHMGKDKKTAVMDSLIDTGTEVLPVKNTYSGYGPIKDMKVVNGKLKVLPAHTKRLSIGGSYSSSIEIKTVNRLPILQSTYAQGSSQNGNIVYHGPETNESFSYGPAIQSLEFDGSSYSYDINGKLVAKGTGNGLDGKAYGNTIFRTASSFAQSFAIQANLLLSPKNNWNFSLKLGDKKENTFIKYNENINQNITASLGSNIGWLNVSATYSHFMDRFSNANRNGFLNRAYQQASITPINFENEQGSMIGTGQRSYSKLADNPYFLLVDNGNAFHQSQDIAGLSLEKKRGQLLFKLDQSIENIQQQSNEMYKAGTAYFANGIATERAKNDRNYYLKANISLSLSDYHFRSILSANYIYNAARTNINYTEGQYYHYQRSAHDVALNYQANFWNYHDASMGVGIGNKFYFSNTANAPAFLLPSLSAYFRQDNIFNIKKVSCKLYSTYNSSKTEPSISNSLAQVNLLQYTTQQSMQYFPLTEVDGYNNLQPIHQNELKLGVEISYTYRLTFSAELFTKQTKHDVFPLYNNGKLKMQNIASHRTKGVELQLTYISNAYPSKKISTINSISFFAFQNKVTDVEAGFNTTPIAGFSNVYKAIVQGQPLGVIIGSSFLRNADNKLVIGADGFPLVNNQPTILGNPTPDFVVKLNNTLNWKRFTLNLDWEWSKGGDRWNGTQAALDYYGRSQTSADARNITNYVFDGVLQNGQHNNIAVTFYDANLPLQQSRFVRYGLTGVAEEYIQKADCIRLRLASLSYNWQFKKYIQRISLGTFINNVVVWTAYKGADPNQLLFDQPNTAGLDYFNLPSTKNMGINLTIQF